MTPFKCFKSALLCLPLLVQMPTANAVDFNLLKNIADAINNSVNATSQTTTQTASGDDKSSGGRMRDTPLSGLLAGGGGEWPRVALTINQLPEWFYSDLSKKGHYDSNDCIVVSFTVWESAGKAKSYDNIRFCGNDIVLDTPYAKLSLWSGFGSARKTDNTGKQRSAGPLPPERLFPNKTGLDMFFPGHGSFYLGGIMATLGYNWNESQDYRFWVVDLPNQAQSKRGETITTLAVKTESSAKSERTEQVASKCTPRHFTQQKFDRIARGMSIEQVNQLIGCQFDPGYNQNSSTSKMRMWAAEDKGLVAAYAIRVNFDSSGKVAGHDSYYKTADGF